METRDSGDLESPPYTPPRIRGDLSPVFAFTTAEAPTSPAAVYRMQRASSGASETECGVDNTASPIRKPIFKKARIISPPLCSLCSANCSSNRGVSLGARVAIAVGIRHFPRGLNGSLIACDTCYKAIAKAKSLLIELEKIIIKAPAFEGAVAPALQVTDSRKIISTLHKTFESNRLHIEAMIRHIAPSHDWSILPAFCGGQLELIKNPKDNKYGLVELCSVNRSSGMVTVQDPISRRPFEVVHERIIPVPETGVAAGVAAAPQVLEAKKKLLTRRLSNAHDEILDLQSHSAFLEKKHMSVISEVHELY